MFSKKKTAKRQQRSDNPLGLDLMTNFDENTFGADNDEDDEDLEAELLRLTAGDDVPARPPRRPAPKPPVQPVAMDILETKEIGSDEELSGDDDDPELLNELSNIVGAESPVVEVKNDPSPSEESKPTDSNAEEAVKALEERLELYKKAEALAKTSNEMSKARRYGRGVKTLQGLLRDAKSGKTVDEAEIPPLLPRSATHAEEPAPEAANPPAETATPVEPTPDPPAAPAVDPEKLNFLQTRQQEFKTAAVAWKKAGNIPEAVTLVKIAKQFDLAIAALNAGQPVDFSDIPPSPQLPGVAVSSESPDPGSREESEVQEQASTPEEPTPPAPVTGEGIAGALKERLEVYRRTKTTAESEGNSSKARRYGRICKQYEDAIKLYERGKSIPIDDLPIPPGFPPISVDPTPPPKPQTPPEPADSPPVAPEEPPRPTAPARAPKNPAGSTTRAQKQTLVLEKRRAEFRRAALAAKEEGDMEIARDYLRQAKGLDPLIEASKCGMPVDMSSIPLSPNAKAELNDDAKDTDLNDSFTLLSSEDIPALEGSGTDQEIYDNLELLLNNQKKVCLSTRDHAKAIGDVPGYNKWERLALGYSRDLDMLRVRKREGLAPPPHHYEVKTYAIVQCCTDLTDQDLEISIIRGINYPKEADTYVIYELPFPSDNPSTDRTSTIRGTVAPEYNATFMVTGIDRSSRQCQRVFKRHSLKCQIWSKGCSMNPLMCCLHPRGFFRSDSLVGTVSIKLQPLETQCILHDSFPLMNGRKATGGKLEVKMRLRNPMATKQIEKKTDKWLIIDY